MQNTEGQNTNKKDRRKRWLIILLLLLLLLLVIFLIYRYVIVADLYLKQGKVEYLQGMKIRGLPEEKGKEVGKVYAADIWANVKFYNGNAIEAHLLLPKSITYIGFDETGSILDHFIDNEPQPDENGYLTLDGGRPTPGFSGRVYIGKIIYKLNQTGGTIDVLSDSKILKNDGQGSEIPFNTGDLNIAQ